MIRKMIAMLSVGAIEQHGPHLPLSVDKVIIDGIIAATVLDPGMDAGDGGLTCGFS